MFKPLARLTFISWTGYLLLEFERHNSSVMHTTGSDLQLYARLRLNELIGNAFLYRRCSFEVVSLEVHLAHVLFRLPEKKLYKNLAHELLQHVN
jgi:hypothetical protein